MLNINNRTDMTEQKRNFDELSKSPASKKKRQFTPSDEKLQHFITISNTSLETDVFLSRQEPSIGEQSSVADQQPSIRQYKNIIF